MELKIPDLSLPKNWEQMQNWFFAIPKVGWQVNILTEIYLKTNLIQNLDSLWDHPDFISDSNFRDFADLYQKGQDTKGENFWMAHRAKFYCLFQQLALHPECKTLDFPPIEGAFRDLRGVVCPNNMAKAQVEISKLPLGSLFEIWIDPGSPIENVPRGLVALGVEILERTKCISQNKVPCNEGRWSAQDFWKLRLRLPA